MSLSLYNFQQEDVETLEKWDGRGLIANEQGTGKTIEALALIQRNPKWLPAVIVCPSHLKWQWQYLAKKFIGLDAAVLSTTTQDWAAVKDQDAVILNPDILMYWLFTLRAMKPGLVIADECQAYTNPEANRTWALKELVEDVPHFVALSGTPINNRPIEFWPVLNMIDPVVWSSRHQFGHRYCRPRRNPFDGQWQFKGCTNADELNTILRERYMVRRLKKEVLKDLPDKTYETVPLKLRKTELREYNQAKADIRSWLRANYRGDKKDGAIRAEALQRVNVLRQLTCDLKIPHVIEWAETFIDSDEKLILFGQHRRFVEGVHDRFTKKSVMVYGGMTDRQKFDAVNRFNDRKDCLLFVGNNAAATGWSATASSNVALGEFPWQPTMVGQMTDRAHGLCRGQEGVATNISFLVAQDTHDEPMVESLQEKEGWVNSVLDGENWQEKQDPVFDAVIKSLMEDR